MNSRSIELEAKNDIPKREPASLIDELDGVELANVIPYRLLCLPYLL